MQVVLIGRYMQVEGIGCNMQGNDGQHYASGWDALKGGKGGGREKERLTEGAKRPFGCERSEPRCLAVLQQSMGMTSSTLYNPSIPAILVLKL